MPLPQSHRVELTRAGGPGAAQAASLPPIAFLPTAVTAFVGRTLKGPPNTPVTVHDFAEFQRCFGGLWQPALLGYAVEQYFENGGREAIIVRVTNGARAPTLRLPAGRGGLLLRGRSPGTREYLRACVDYDGIAAEATGEFNLVLQRLRTPGSQLIEDQETVRRVCVQPDSPHNVERALAQSRLMKVIGALPAQRPDATRAMQAGGVNGYVAANSDGTDGADLSDYDLIGDEAAASGLFALRRAPRFDLLCIPPLRREQDPGLATLLVAARLCRSRQALLIVDAPRHWDQVPAALAGAAAWAFHSEDAFMVFPRLQGLDRLRGRAELFAASGAAAGLVARADASSPLWSAAAGEPPVLRPGLRLSVSLGPAERLQLARLGVNCLDDVRPGAGPQCGARVLVPENAIRSTGRSLPARRLSLWLQACILDGTRWTLARRNEPDLWERAGAQVTDFLESVAQAGAFAGRDSEERYFVICDRRVNQAQEALGCRLLFGFAAFQPGEFQTCLVSHTVAGSRVRVVSLNRLAHLSAGDVQQIETAMLRQLVQEPPASLAQPEPARTLPGGSSA